MFEFCDNVINKIWNDTNVDPTTFAHDFIEHCHPDLTDDQANFIAGEIAHRCSMRILETCKISDCTPFTVENFERFTALVNHSNAFLKKVNETCVFISSYDTWKHNFN